MSTRPKVPQAKTGCAKRTRFPDMRHRPLPGDAPVTNSAIEYGLLLQLVALGQPDGRLQAQPPAPDDGTGIPITLDRAVLAADLILRRGQSEVLPRQIQECLG